jgi:hypothetical protein
MRNIAAHRTGSLVRVLNPSWLGRLLGETDEASASHLAARPGTPSTVAELGGLVAIALDADTLKSKVIRALNATVKTDDHGDKAWAFNQKQVRLVADANGDLHIVGFFLKPTDELQPNKSYLIGNVLAVTYQVNGEPVPREHEFCEHGGDCPKLYFKDGYLLFRGGTYSVTPQGLIG